ncbi:hypothetical protein HanIR_Chr04g0191341 [Helianthus annuus]|nr:hypothetical protein HanIR_Chr04g0191341 [Helianthus annuus]
MENNHHYGCHRCGFCRSIRTEVEGVRFARRNKPPVATGSARNSGRRTET